MQVQIQNSSWKVLEYKTPGACAFDFEAAEDVVFAPGEWKLVETGTVIATPVWYCLVVAPRSSIFKNYWLMQVNSIGIVDQDYSGETDTVKFPYMNMRKEEVIIKKWERIGQGMFVKIEKPEFILVDKMGGESRGGFGTTGIN